MPEKRTGLKTRATVHAGLRQTKTGAKVRNISNPFQSFPCEMPFNVSGGSVLGMGCASAAVLQERLPTIRHPGATMRGDPDFVPVCPTRKHVTI